MWRKYLLLGSPKVGFLVYEFIVRREVSLFISILPILFCINDISLKCHIVTCIMK